MQFTDTHCHIHFPDYPLEPSQAIADAQAAGVSRLMCVGCTLADSKIAVDFAQKWDNIWATIGLHPHEAKVYVDNTDALQEFRDLASRPRVVAIGETGLDFYYNHSNADDQKRLLRYQLELGLEFNLPFVFHVRDAFEQFWAIIDDYEGVRGVIHSFTAGDQELDQALSRGLYIGLNGITTFTKDQKQLEAVKRVPTDRLLLETDAPFLTPKPFRGTICEPKHLRQTAEFLAELRGEKLESIAKYSTDNTQKLFNLV